MLVVFFVKQEIAEKLINNNLANRSPIMNIQANQSAVNQKVHEIVTHIYVVMETLSTINILNPLTGLLNNPEQMQVRTAEKLKIIDGGT